MWVGSNGVCVCVGSNHGNHVYVGSNHGNHVYVGSNRVCVRIITEFV